MNDTQIMIQFVTDSIYVLKENGVEYEFINAEKIIFGDDGEGICGYFDEDVPKLSVAIGKSLKEWFDVFVHEYCHFEQWTEKIELWDKCLTDDGDEVLNDVLSHFKGELELSKKQVRQYLDYTAKLELDCELRVLKKVEEYGLPIDPKQYAKEANSYIVFYYALEHMKKWCVTAPYHSKAILKVMPDHMDGVDHKALAKKYIKLYKSKCLK